METLTLSYLLRNQMAKGIKSKRKRKEKEKKKKRKRKEKKHLYGFEPLTLSSKSDAPPVKS